MKASVGPEPRSPEGENESGNVKWSGGGGSSAAGGASVSLNAVGLVFVQGDRQLFRKEIRRV